MDHCNTLSSSGLTLAAAPTAEEEQATLDSGTAALSCSFPLLEPIMRHTREGIVIMDSRGRIQKVNPAFCRFCDVTAQQLLGRHITDINSDLHQRRYYQDIWQTLQRQDYWQGEVIHETGEPTLVTHHLQLQRVFGGSQQESHIVGILDDVNQLKYSEAQLSYLAHHDVLTGCANRAFLLSWFKKLTASLAAEQQLAVLFIDLDRFKPINDSFGHEVGDKVLMVLAKRLQALVDANELVARIGGDEFVMVHNPQRHEGGLSAYADRVLQALSEPVFIDNYVLNVGASIGMSIYPEHGQDIESLLRYADIAMYHAKRTHHAKMCVFDQQQMVKIERQRRLMNDCAYALEHHEFFLEYQPVFALDGQRLISLEVLLRWRHPELGILHPDQIIPPVRAAGLLYALSEWVFIKAAQQLRDWQTQHQWHGHVSINLSGIELEQLNVPALLGHLPKLGVCATQFSLELCSDYMMQCSPSLKETISRLRAAGMHIYLNKLGLGQLNLGKLAQLPLDGIKLDSDLLSATDTKWSEAIIGSILLLAKALNVTVIACGIEYQHHWQQMQALGCHGAQGRLLAPPLMAAELNNPASLVSKISFPEPLVEGI